jgi:hypothetical protein
MKSKFNYLSLVVRRCVGVARRRHRSHLSVANYPDYATSATRVILDYDSGFLIGAYGGAIASANYSRLNFYRGLNLCFNLSLDN